MVLPISNHANTDFNSKYSDGNISFLNDVEIFKVLMLKASFVGLRN